MAKSAIGRGQFSGRLGGDVFVVRNGKQIIRAYQPIVANPKSLPQRLQRAKGNLVGQISKITPWQILEGLGNNKVARRSRFLQLALRNADSIVNVSDPSEIIASLKADKFIFSEGAIVPCIQVVSAQAFLAGVSVLVGRIPNTTDEDLIRQGVLVVVTVMQTSGEYESVLYAYAKGEDMLSGNITVTLPHPRESAYVAGVYLAPFSTVDGSSLTVVANSLYGDGADFNASMIANPSALPLVWGLSNYVTDATFTPSSKSDDEPVEEATKKKK